MFGIFRRNDPVNNVIRNAPLATDIVDQAVTTLRELRDHHLDRMQQEERRINRATARMQQHALAFEALNEALTRLTGELPTNNESETYFPILDDLEKAITLDWTDPEQLQPGIGDVPLTRPSSAIEAEGRPFVDQFLTAVDKEQAKFVANDCNECGGIGSIPVGDGREIGICIGCGGTGKASDQRIFPR